MPLNVVFIGTPEFAVASLDAIHKSPHHVSAVITTPDKPAGRGQILTESAIKKYTRDHQIACFQPESLKSAAFIMEMKKLQPDIMVVVAFKFLPKVFYSIPKFGTFNLHASLLPELRGASPINFAIINGYPKTGVSTFFLNENIDTGNILLQKEVEIEHDETAGTLHDKLMNLGKDLVVETLNGIENYSLHGKIQDSNKTSYAPKIDKEFCRISWKDSLENIDRKIRGLSPYPTAFTQIKIDTKEKGLKIFQGKIQYAPTQGTPGSLLIEADELKIIHSEGYYIPSEVQLEGKRKMQVKDFINGLHHKENLKVV